jgi:hypothetical protein
MADIVKKDVQKIEEIFMERFEKQLLNDKLVDDLKHAIPLTGGA